MARLSDICLKIGSGATPTGGKSAYLSEGISLIRSQNVLDLSFTEDGLAFISVEQAKKLDNVEIQEGDILLNITGDSVARVCIVPSHILPARVNQHVAIIRVDKKKADNYYVLYSLIKSKRLLLTLASAGATRNALTKKMIEDFEINLPSLSDQHRIASILSSLDDKIAVNRRICENLEAQAQALFKHWFIDFAPFQNGKFVESELGMIPEGWRVGTLGDIAEFKRGRTITKTETQKGNVPVVAGGLEPAYYHNIANTSSRVITISGSGANAGFTRMYYLPVWASDCSYVDNVSTQYLHTAYCYLLNSRRKVDALQWGAAQPHVYAKDINKLPLAIAPLDLLSKFEEQIIEMFDQIEVMEKENTRLTTLRDTLLPKLMSGEIKL